MSEEREAERETSGPGGPAAHAPAPCLGGECEAIFSMLDVPVGFLTVDQPEAGVA